MWYTNFSNLQAFFDKMAAKAARHKKVRYHMRNSTGLYVRACTVGMIYTLYCTLRTIYVQSGTESYGTLRSCMCTCYNFKLCTGNHMKCTYSQL